MPHQAANEDPMLLGGVNSTGAVIPLKLNDDGTLSSSGGGGGSSGAVTDSAAEASLAALAAYERPFQGVIAMVVDTAQAAQRAVRIICTAAGNVSLTYADGSTDIVPIAVGLSYIAGAITKVNSTGTTATATYANMK